MNHINHLTIAIAAIAGLASAVHCVGMCSGIAGALSASLPIHVRNNRRDLITYIAFYNFGRILSYAIAGFIVGSFSEMVFHFLNNEEIQWVAKLLAMLVLMTIGLHLMGVFRRISALDVYGRAIWRILQPYGQKLLPVHNLRQAFLFGMVWGWLPCGLVYFMLTWTMASGGPLQGAEIMMAFGVGTFPTLILAGVLSSWFFKGNTLKLVRSISGAILIAFAIGELLVPAHHSMHMMNQLH